MTTRATVSDPWQVPANVGPLVNTHCGEYPAGLSSDNQWLYLGELVSSRPGGCGDYDLWQVPVLPILDIDGNGTIDSTDVSVMVDCRGTVEPTCDIGPTPFGDGIVDMQDLMILAEYLFGDLSLAQ